MPGPHPVASTLPHRNRPDQPCQRATVTPAPRLRSARPGAGQAYPSSPAVSAASPEEGGCCGTRDRAAAALAIQGCPGQDVLSDGGQPRCGRSRPPGPGPVASACAELPGGLSLALVLAEPALGAHPEHHILVPGVRVIADVPVAAERTEVAAGHRPPLGGIEFLLADDRPFDADIPVGRACILGAHAEPPGGTDRRCLARAAAGQHGQQAARLIAVPDRDRQRLARGACCRAQHTDMHASKELRALGSTHGATDEGFIPDRGGAHDPTVRVRAAAPRLPGRWPAARGVPRRAGAPIATMGRYISLLALPSGGALGVSVAPASSADDIERFAAFVETTYQDRVVSASGLPPRQSC